MVLAMQSSHPGMTISQRQHVGTGRDHFSRQILARVDAGASPDRMHLPTLPLKVSIHSTDQQAAVRGQSMQVWVNADIEVASSLSDAVDVWPGGMNLDGSMWGVGGWT